MTRSEAGRLGGYANRLFNERQHEYYKQKYEEHPDLCQYCGRPIPYEKRGNKFCDHSCSAIYNNSKRELKRDKEHIVTVPKKYRTPRFCEECGKQLPENKRVERRFCSRACSSAYSARKYHDALLKQFVEIEAVGEFQSAFQGEADRRIVKKYLEHKYGHKCSICGITEWMGQSVPLVVDHIDGNALNRKVENFRLVCANCDAQLPTYKSKNKHGRKWRHKYEQYK